MADDDARLAVVIEARLDKLQSQLNGVNRSIHGSMAKAQKDIDETDKKWSRMFLGEGPGKALDKVFSRARLGAVEEGSAKIGVFGSAVEALGPIGIGAAVGIATLTAAFEQAHKAAEFADEIEDTAGRIHVSTDALQEYRYAIRAAGGDTAGADQALEAFSENLGKAEQGLKKGQRAFLALGFTKEQIDGFHGADDALRQVVGRISELKNNEQKDTIIDQLGLKGLKPLIQQGSSAMEALLQQAKDVGAVMDSDLIHKGAEANKQFELLSKVIDVQLKSAFIDLAPVLTGLLTFAAQFARDIARAVDALRSAEHRSVTTLRAEADSQRRLADANNPIANATTNIEALSSGRTPADVRRARRAHADALDWMADRKELDLAAEDQKLAGGRSLLPPAGAAGGGKGHAARDDNAQALDAAVKAELSAHAALLQVLLDQSAAYEDQGPAIQQLADFKRQEIDAEQKVANHRADRQLKEKSITAATAEQVKAKAAQAADEKRTALALETQRKVAEATRAQEEAQFAYSQDIRGAYSEIAGIAAAAAKTSAERRALELRDFDLNARLDRDILEAKNAYLVSIQKITQSEADARLNAFDDLHAAQRGGVLDRTKGPLEQGRDQARGEADSVVAGIVKTDDIAGRYAEMYEQIDRLRKEDVISEQQAQQAKSQIMSQEMDERLGTASMFFNTLSQLSSSGNKRLAAIGKAAAIAEATIDGIKAVIKALGAAPPPLNFALAAATGVAVAAQIAKMSGVGGFEQGGYTGNGGRSQVAGAVHGQEYVFDADTTARNRPLLDMLQSGGTFRMPAIPTRQVSNVSPQLHMTVRISGNGDRELQAMMERTAAAAGHAAYQQAMVDAPTRMDSFQKLGS